MNSYLLVALGSAIGGALRHGVNVGSVRLLGSEWPYGTFFVNVVGSFLIGIVAAYCAFRGEASQPLRLFLATGMIGGFTTFSAFSLEVALIYERGQTTSALLYAVASVVVSVLSLFAGMAVIRYFSG